ncbi:uncharacterized protein [Periplaneta americana]|uniref:uncharacterized protein isoform X4 n=1 Tax=Periplaneta americana TaxID=6978 RepID=UPI0037E994DD
MDEIKMEPGVDPLELQPHDNTWKIEENNILSEPGTLLNMQAMGMKTESCFDTSWIKIEDQPVVKCEGEEYSFDLERVQQEQKMEMSTEEDEVVTESADLFQQATGVAQSAKELACQSRVLFMRGFCSHLG